MGSDMETPSLEQLRELADRLGITPDGFGEGERHWDWATDYPVIIRVLAALEAVEATATVQHGHPSAYWVKHQVEHDLGEYVSQGAVILAWVALQRSLQRHPGERHGAFLAISKRCPIYRRWLFARR